MTTKTTRLQAKSFDVPDQSFPVAGVARVEVVHLGDTTANRVTFQPGFRWSEHVKPTVGTDLCEIPHTGYVVSGRIGVRMADGTERELGAGDAFAMPAGHDVWVVGDEPYVAVDFSPTEDAAVPLKG
jgi:quercetin dioxygenase-like cupin family protein